MKIASDTMTKWDLRWLKLADYIATEFSKDPSTKVGAVIANGKKFISLGYNGFPEGVADDDRLHNRELKYQLIVHGERNAIIYAQRDLTGCTLYTHPFMPCSICAGMVIQSGIRRVVTRHSTNERWTDSFDLTRGMFTEAGVELLEMYRVPSMIKLEHPPYETVGDDTMKVFK